MKSLKTISAEYGIKPETLKKYIKPILPTINYRKNQKLLTPIQVKMIYGFLGHPSDLNT